VASLAYLAGRPAASGPMAKAVISAVVASGPIDGEGDELRRDGDASEQVAAQP
jgi:hypothetical protein